MTLLSINSGFSQRRGCCGKLGKRGCTLFNLLRFKRKRDSFITLAIKTSLQKWMRVEKLRIEQLISTIPHFSCQKFEQQNVS